jgi:hypothetical protein
MVAIIENHPKPDKINEKRSIAEFVSSILPSADRGTTMDLDHDETDILPNGTGLGWQIFKINNASKT